MPRYFKRFGALHVRGLGGGGGELPPVSGATTVAFSTFSNDGLTTTGRATGTLPFKPGEVHVADLANAYVWDMTANAEVNAYIEDMGARHLGEGDDDALLSAYIEIDTTLSGINATKDYELRWDRASAPTRLVKAGIDRFADADNPFTVSLDATHKKFHVAAFTYWNPVANEVVRHAGGDVEFAFNGFIPASFTASGDTYQYIMCGVCVELATGTLKLYNIEGSPRTTSALSDGRNFNPGANVPYDGTVQMIGTLIIHVANGTTYAYGTTALDAAGITATVTGGTKVPYSVLPRNVSKLSLAPNDPAYMVDTKFAGELLATSAQWAATPAEIRDMPTMIQTYSDMAFTKVGYDLTTDIAGWTIYEPSLMEYKLYAVTGSLRHMRRALLANQSIRDQLELNGWSTNEPYADCVVHLFEYALTNDPRDLTNIAAMTTAGEQAYLGVSGGDGTPHLYSGTGRRGKHVVHTMPWAERLGVNLHARVAAYALSDSDVLQQDWPNKLTYRSVTTNADRWLRMMDYFNHLVQPNTQAGTGRYLVLSDYSFKLDGSGGHYNNINYGCGPFMQNFIWSKASLGMKVFGIPTFALAAIKDTTEHLWTGTSPVDGYVPQNYGAAYWNGGVAKPEYSSFIYSPANDLNPAEAFTVYDNNSALAKPLTGPGDALLNGCQFGALEWLIDNDSANASTWRSRGDYLIRAMLTKNNGATWAGSWCKTTSEIGLFTLGWPRHRTA